MYGLLLALVLTQAPAAEKPSAVVLVERRVGLSAEEAQALAGEVSGLLEKEKIPIAAAPEDAGSCGDQRPCLLERARDAGATVAVLLKANSLTGTLTLNLEAVTVEDGTSLWKDLFLVTEGKARKQDLKEGIAPLAETLRPKLAPPKPEPVAKAEPKPDVPLATPPVQPPPLKPSVEPPQPAPITFQPEPAAPSGKRSRALMFATGGGTIAAVGAAVAFGLMGKSQKRQLDESLFTENSRQASSLTRAQADHTASRANLYFNVALSSAIVSAALGTTTGYLWLKD